MLNRDQKCSRESKIPVPISRQKVIVSPAKMEDKKNKSRLYMSTCSRRAQEEENFRKRNVTKQTEKTSSFQKPQSIQLKQDIEKLRRKTAKDESIIKNQQVEIKKLKQVLSNRNSTKRTQLQSEIQNELIEKYKLQQKLDLIMAEKQKLSSQLIDLLEVKSIPVNRDSQQLEHLRAQIKKNKDVFQLKLQEYQNLLEQKEIFIQEQQTKREFLLSQHQNKIRQIEQDFSERVKSLESKHKQTKSIPKPKMNQDMINQLIEQALREFEQEQYNHVPEFTHAIHLPTLKTGRYYPVNQQIYAQKYMPFDAISWPTPIDL